MTFTKRGKRLATGGISSLVLTAGIVGAAHGSSSTPVTAPSPADLHADIASGKARPLPESPNSWTYTSVWRNCGFVIIKTHNTHYTDGDSEIAVMDSSPADVEAQMPPVDPACAGARPTAAQIAEDQAQLQALSEAARPKSAHPGSEGGSPGPPPHGLPPPAVP